MSNRFVACENEGEVEQLTDGRLPGHPSRARLERGVALTCPALPRAGVASFPDPERSPDVRAHPLDVIGLELRVAFAAIGTGDVGAGDNDFWLRKCRELCLRPAIEPLLLAHWVKLKSFAMSSEQMAAFSAQLCGSKTPQQPRTRDVYGLWGEADVRFESPDRARRWWSEIQAVAARPDMNGLLPAYAFARTILAHPYPDGNGRLARALVHGALGRIGNLAQPVPALAPAFYRNGAKIAGALRELSASGDWIRFNYIFSEVVHDALSMAARVQ